MNALLGSLLRGLDDESGVRVLATHVAPEAFGNQIVVATYREIFIRLATDRGDVCGEIGPIGGRSEVFWEAMAQLGWAQLGEDPCRRDAFELGAAMRKTYPALVEALKDLAVEASLPARRGLALWPSAGRTVEDFRSALADDRRVEVLSHGSKQGAVAGALLYGDLYVELVADPALKGIDAGISTIGGELCSCREAMAATGPGLGSRLRRADLLAAAIRENYDALVSYLSERLRVDAGA